MSEVVISIRRIGKRYKLGVTHSRPNYKALRDTIAGIFNTSINFSINKKSIGEKYNNQYIWALKDVSFDVLEGEVIGILGKNGAGKSTLLKILSYITEPTEGDIHIKGRVASLLEVGTGFHPELTGRENILMNGAILGMTRAEIMRKFDEIVDFAEVEKFIETPVKRYSSGMYIRLAFAIAAHLEPEILLVDEVLAVGDVAFQKKCLGKMESATKSGRTVLFVSHNMAAIKSLCRRGILLEGGRISDIGSIKEIVDSYLSNSFIKKEINNYVVPIFNKSYGIGITDLSIKLEPDSGGKLLLEIELEVQVEQRLKNIGVGLSLISTSGVKVCILGPAVTNYVIKEISGNCRCVLYCKEIDKYLASGDYIVSLWLSKPKIEYLIKIEEAVQITIPPRDVFSSGMYFEERQHGIVPLPLRFLVKDI